MRYDVGSVGRISSLMFDIQNLREPLLHAATLSPFTIKQAGQLMENEKCRCSVRANWFFINGFVVVLQC